MAYHAVCFNGTLKSKTLPINIRTRIPFCIKRSTVMSVFAQNPGATDLAASKSKSNEFNMEEYMAIKARRVTEALDLSVPLCHPATIHEPMRYSLLAGGKRIHPILTLAACELVGGDEDLAMPVACAVEMIHTMSLIHNNLQRGSSTNLVDIRECTAILSGDALHALAFKHVAASAGHVQTVRVLRAVAELASAVGSEGMSKSQIIFYDD